MKTGTIIFGIILMLPQLCKADIIFFKDGMRTVCQEKAWEEDQEVKCEYQGTILSYQKKDVLRIQEIRTSKKAPPAKPEKTPEKPVAAVAKPSTDLKAPDAKPKLPDKKDIKLLPVQPGGVSNTRELEFYNPRRAHKYWTSAVSKHKTFKEAIAALAKQYDRSPDWIQQHMGETNDLNEIHQNLAGSKLNAPVETKVQTQQKVSDTLFYNPRRPQKYWTSAMAKHKTFKEAVNALSAQYGRSNQWVQQYMGKSNNLDEIHQNLQNQKLSESSPE